jgi:hypothetical protein
MKPRMASNLVTKENDMTNTTKLMTKLAVAIGLIGSLAFSAATPSLARSSTAAFAQVPSTAQALVNRQQHSSNPRNDVYENGRYIGSDPDPFIRDMLRADPPPDAR